MNGAGELLNNPEALTEMFLEGIRTRLRAILNKEIDDMIAELRTGLDGFVEKSAGDVAIEVKNIFSMADPKYRLEVLIKPFITKTEGA